MERGESGYMKVTAGVSDPLTPLPPSARRRLNEAECRTLVERLRHQGWSYRRISSELKVSYSTVSRWLDAPVASPPIESLPVPVGGPRPSPRVAIARVQPVAVAVTTVATPAVEPRAPEAPPGLSESTHALVERLVTQNRTLLDRVDELAVASTRQLQIIPEVEMRLTESIAEQHKNLGDRIIATIRAMLGKISPD
jgi:hypothetical protein